MNVMKGYRFNFAKLPMVLLAFVFLIHIKGTAQELPFREYANPDEIVTFDRSVNFVEALDIIGQFALEYENRFMVNNSDYTGSIGVSLPAMHWKDALSYILKFRGLELRTYPDYYEIRVPEVKTTARSADTPGSSDRVVQEILKATTATREVRINATFFEGNRRALREVGVDWSTLTKNVPSNLGQFVNQGGGSGGSGGGGGSGGSGGSGGAGGTAGQLPDPTFSDQFVSINAKGANQVSQNVFNALINLGEVGPVSVQGLFSAFESNNLGNILATPSIKVMDGEQGKIQVGQDFSIKQRDFAGNVTDAFFSTGTILTVTPTVINYQDTTFIHLELQVERSTAQPDAVSTIINKQEASTQTLLLNGEATSIAGLYRTEHSTIRRGIPILKDLPPWFFGLRYLFGFNSDDKDESELVILVQAELEKTLADRMREELVSKSRLLSDERDWFRNNMDLVPGTDAEKALLKDLEAAAEEPVAEKEQKQPEPEAEEEKPEETQREIQPEKETAEKTEPVPAADDRELKDLMKPVKDPELMVVVPKAFDLNEYLEKQENGEIEEIKEDRNVKYFVIGGAFLVPDNAFKFSEKLDNEGYDTRILYNSGTRFNYVAYYGFSDREEAIRKTREMREDTNPGAWLFIKEGVTVFKD